MNKKTVIFLTVVITLLVAIICAGLYALYADVQPVVKDQPAIESEAKGDVAPKAEDAIKEETAKADPAGEEAAKADAPAKEAAPEKEPAKAEPAKSAERTFTVFNCATGRNNTLRQNADNSLVLIDHVGKQLWKINFPAPIVGDVVSMDLYNNKKIQFFMAAADKLHLIDRLGREVKAFPIALGSVAKSGPVAKNENGKVFWQVETAKGTVYFDKKTVKISNTKP